MIDLFLVSYIDLIIGVLMIVGSVFCLIPISLEVVDVWPNLETLPRKIIGLLIVVVAWLVFALGLLFFLSWAAA